MTPNLLHAAVVLTILSFALALPENVVRVTPEAIADISAFAAFNNASGVPQFQVYDDSFLSLLGESPTLSLIYTSSNASFPQFHEAAILARTTPPVLFVTSNQFTYSGINSPNTDNKTVAITKVSQDAATQKWSAENISPIGTPIFSRKWWCDLANPGGFVELSPSPPYTASKLINNYLGKPFNSPNDVTFTRDGAMWFTDPQFGFVQNIRPVPELPPQVYRWVPGTTDIRVVADGISSPNGIGFSPDEKIAYITNAYPNVCSVIYAYDVVGDGPGPLLANKRTFATPGVGIPDGIKTDAQGNVYAGCGDGVNVWNSQGLLIGKIMVEGGAANFALSEKGEVYILNERNLYLATLGVVACNSTVLARRRKV